MFTRKDNRNTGSGRGAEMARRRTGLAKADAGSAGGIEIMEGPRQTGSTLR